MDTKMTWTVIYKDNNSLSQKIVNAPHGKTSALKFINTNLFPNSVLAIIPGAHEITFYDINLTNES